MSHFTVMVIGDNPEEQLAPYNEHIEMPRYVKYTREQLIEKGKKSIESYKNGMYAEYLSDPEKYASKCSPNTGHLDYIKNEFPLKLSWSDDQIYEEEIKYYEPEEIGPDGEVYSTYNPKSKWDWFVLGGRWSGLIQASIGNVGRPGVFQNAVGIDQALKKDITNLNEIVTFAILKDGQWYERGEMGWWGVVHDEKDDKVWDEQVKKLTSELPEETLISIYDCHI